MDPTAKPLESSQFPAISTVKFVFLIIFSGGLYSVVWLAQRMDRFNQIGPQEVVRGKDLVWLSVLAGFPLLFANGESQVEANLFNFVSGVAVLAEWVYWIVLTFRLNDLLENLGQSEFGAEHFKTNKLWAFVFLSCYLNYKINQIEQFRSWQQPTTQPSEPAP